MAGKCLELAMAALSVDSDTADFRVVVGEHTIHAHKLILAARSPFFKTAMNTAVEEEKGMVVIQTKSVEVVSAHERGNQLHVRHRHQTAPHIR